MNIDELNKWRSDTYQQYASETIRVAGYGRARLRMKTNLRGHFVVTLEAAELYSGYSPDDAIAAYQSAKTGE